MPYDCGSVHQIGLYRASCTGKVKHGAYVDGSLLAHRHRQTFHESTTSTVSNPGQAVRESNGVFVPSIASPYHSKPCRHT